MNPSPGPWSWADGKRPVLLSALDKPLIDVTMETLGFALKDDFTVIALAPEMREMLLAEEWHDIDGDLECPECGTVRRYAESVNPVVYHYSDCKRGALLEKLR